MTETLHSMSPQPLPENERPAYVLGFVFDGDVVLLIRKNRPAHLKGLLNGIGGKIELGETPLEAMIRECKEEAGIECYKTGWWTQFCVIQTGYNIIHCFWCYGPISEAKQNTDEMLLLKHSIDVKNYRTTPKTVENLPWLFAMIESQKIDGVNFYVVKYVR